MYISLYALIQVFQMQILMQFQPPECLFSNYISTSIPVKDNQGKYGRYMYF